MTILWLDEYERYARLTPGLLALLPIVVTGIALGLEKYPFTTLIVSAVVGLGGPVALASVVRERGVTLEQRLFASWGGPPTTQLLRSVGASNDPDRDRRRSAVEKVTGLTLPAPEDEMDDPVAADALYQSGVRDLRARTYDKEKFPLIFKENRYYGFARNTLAIRAWGIASSATSAVIAGFLSLAILFGSVDEPRLVGPLLGFLICLVLLVAWWFIPTEAWVKRSAHRYAHQILAVAPSLANG